MRRRMRFVGIGLLLALVLPSSRVLAQITTGTVSGNVKDPTGRRDPRRDGRAHQRNARNEVGARRHQRNRQLRVSQRHGGHLHRGSHVGRVQDRASAAASP